MDLSDETIRKLSKYKSYLNTIQPLLDKYFEEQKDYVFCKRGCSYCCEKGVYPYSEIEFQYLYLGYLNLSKEEKIEIAKRTAKLKEDYLNSKISGEKFIHRCPFLRENGECSVYDFRGLICRTFGILHIDKENHVTMPFCQELGLNFSNIYNKETKNFNYDVVEEKGYAHPPIPYPITRPALMDKDLFEGEPLDFGETKALIDWI